MYPASFEYLAPTSLDETLSLLAKHGDDAKLLAGGHSLVPAMKLRLIEPRYLIDLSHLPDMRGIRVDGEELVAGALTLHADVASSEAVRVHLPALAEAAAVIGDLQVRNRGTIGGSVAHADPAADFPVILLALDASFVLVSPSASRTVAAGDFFIDFFTTALEPGEVLTEIHVPLQPAGTGMSYVKLSHPASGYVVVSAGAAIARDAANRCSSARVVVGGLSGAPARAAATEAELLGQPLSAEVIALAAAKAADGTDPEGDLYGSAEYKRHLATVYVRRAVERAAERATA
ncbi:MAG: FAD binding domain-containing protein [Chloroflexota bacterium]